MKLIDIINRMGSDISSLLPVQTFQLLNEFEFETIRKNEGQLVIDVLGEETLLTQKKFRDKIFQYLNSKQAIDLLHKLDIPCHDESNPWETLNKLSFPENSERQNILFEFFSIERMESDICDVREESANELIYPQYPLFDHQANAIKEVLHYLNSQQNRVLLHMPTGSGKTRTAMNIVCNFFRNDYSNNSLVVWLANTKELCEQACDEFKHAWSCLGHKKIETHKRFDKFDDSIDSISSGFLVSGVDMLYSRSISEDKNFLKLVNKIKLVIFDEAHLAVAPTYENLVNCILAGASKPGLIGLSATPGRSSISSDDENQKLAELFFRQKVILKIPGYANPIQYLQSEKYIAKVNYESIPYTPKDINKRRIIIKDKDISPEILKELGLDEKRNALIIESIIRQIKLQKKIIVFAPSVESAIIIASILRFLGYRAGVITATSPSRSRVTTIEQYKNGDIQILVNYGVLTTGFDAPKTNVAIIARPTNSLVLYSQMVGRAIRGSKAGGNDEAFIYTVVDQISGFKDLSKAFLNWEEIWI